MQGCDSSAKSSSLKKKQSRHTFYNELAYQYALYELVDAKMSKSNAWGQIAPPTASTTKPSFASILQDQQEEEINATKFKDQEDDQILQAVIEASLLDVCEVSTDDGVPLLILDKEEEVRPGTVTAVQESVIPMLMATQIDDEDSEDEAENKKNGVIYTEVLATAPIHPDEMEALEKKCEEDLQATLKFLEDEKIEMRKLRRQQEEDASLALSLQLQEEEASRLQAVVAGQQQHNNGGQNQHRKIQFVSKLPTASNLTSQEEKFYDDEEDYDDYDYEDECEGKTFVYCLPHIERVKHPYRHILSFSVHCIYTSLVGTLYAVLNRLSNQ